MTSNLATIEGAVVIIVKRPEPGRSKTRLCPPLTPVEASAVADAALRDTFDAVSNCGAVRKVVSFDGDPSGVVPEHFEIFAQHGDGLDERLAAAFDDVGCRAIIIAMDTPQVSAAMLNEALASLDDHDVSLGPTIDGGYWYIGLADPSFDVIRGVPMSTEDTYSAQVQRVSQAGLSLHVGPTLRDIDEFDDAVAVVAGMEQESATVQMIKPVLNRLIAEWGPSEDWSDWADAAR